MLLLSRANLGSAKLHNANILLVVNQGWPKSSADFHCGGAADVMKLSFVSDSKNLSFGITRFFSIFLFFSHPSVSGTFCLPSTRLCSATVSLA